MAIPIARRMMVLMDDAVARARPDEAHALADLGTAIVLLVNQDLRGPACCGSAGSTAPAGG